MSFFFSSRRRHTRLQGDWSSDVCSSDLDRLRRRRLDADRLRQRRGLRPLHGQRDARAGLGGAEEIGRESCRERGEISVVAGSLKKKKSENQCRYSQLNIGDITRLKRRSE